MVDLGYRERGSGKGRVWGVACMDKGPWVLLTVDPCWVVGSLGSCVVGSERMGCADGRGEAGRDFV